MVKILAVAAELFDADSQVSMTKLIVAFLKFCERAWGTQSVHGPCPSITTILSITAASISSVTGVPPYSLIQYPWFTTVRKKIGKLKKIFVNFKTPAKRERAVKWWNTAAQTRPVLESAPFAPVLTLHRRTCHNSASSTLAVRISCRVIAEFLFRRPLFIN
jgi:hypothetical protein